MKETGSTSVGSTFATTHWSLVRRAGQTTDEDALATLCSKYWYPVYAYIRRMVGDVHEAQDLCQGFFVHFLERNLAGRADQQRGSFRAFMKTAVSNFCKNEWQKLAAKKRGGHCVTLSLDYRAAEGKYCTIEPADHFTAEELYEQEWMYAVVETVLAQLRAECAPKGQEKRFDVLKNFIVGSSAEKQTAAAEKLGLTPGAVQQAIRALQNRFGQLFAHEVGQTVSQPGEIDDEMRVLLAAIKG